MWGSLTELERSVRTGRPGLEALEPNGLWAYLRDRPGEAAVFARAMTAKAGAAVAAVLTACDFTRFTTIADIGGGRGHLLTAVLDAAPSATGILFDLPEVIGTLDVHHPRMTVAAGNFFADALPTADAYVLMDVLHDWPDEECVAILSAIRRAAPADAALLVVEPEPCGSGLGSAGRSPAGKTLRGQAGIGVAHRQSASRRTKAITGNDESLSV